MRRRKSEQRVQFSTPRMLRDIHDKCIGIITCASLLVKNELHILGSCEERAGGDQGILLLVQGSFNRLLPPAAALSPCQSPRKPFAVCAHRKCLKEGALVRKLQRQKESKCLSLC